MLFTANNPKGQITKTAMLILFTNIVKIYSGRWYIVLIQEISNKLNRVLNFEDFLKSIYIGSCPLTQKNENVFFTQAYYVFLIICKIAKSLLQIQCFVCVFFVFMWK